MKARHSRQARLVEVGERGQAAIAGLSCRVRGDGVAARIEARYLAGAGVGRLTVEADVVARSVEEIDGTVQVFVATPESPARGPLPGPAWAAELAPSARAVAVGSHRALAALRRAVLAEGIP